MAEGCWRHAKPRSDCDECKRKADAEKNPAHIDNIMKPGSPINTAIFS